MSVSVSVKAKPRESNYTPATQKLVIFSTILLLFEFIRYDLEQKYTIFT